MATKPDRDVPTIDDQPFLDANSRAKSRYGRFNLAIIGGTGVGKSSLVNAVFGRDLAQVGRGLPVTAGIHYYHDESLGIWDFEGFEIGSSKSPAETLRGHLKAVIDAPADQQIAVVWYCLLSKSDRLTQPDIDMIRELDAAGLPVIVVLTKVDWVKNPVTGRRKPPKDVEQFKAWLDYPVDADGQQIDIPIQSVILTCAAGKNRKGAGHGLGELVAATLSLSPAGEKDAFRIAQRLNLPWKRDMARRVIVGASAAAGTAAAVPIPVADAVTLAPIQLGMMGRIAAIYDLELTTLLSAHALAQLGAQIAGKALARSFLKLIPGAGSAINTAVAVALTGATGEGWLRLCEQIHTGKIEPGKISDAWDDFSPTIVTVLKKLTERQTKA